MTRAASKLRRDRALAARFCRLARMLAVNAYAWRGRENDRAFGALLRDLDDCLAAMRGRPDRGHE